MNEIGLQGVMIQMFSHGINIIGLWIVVDLVEQQTGHRKISELGALHSKHLHWPYAGSDRTREYCPATYQCLCGRVPDVHRIFKFNPWYAGAAGISIILAAVYTLNMVKNVFYGNLNQETLTCREIRIHESFILAVLVVMIFLVGVYPAPMFEMVRISTEVIMSRITGN